MGLNFIEFLMDLSDELVGEGVGFGVEKEVEDVVFLFEDGGLFELLGGHLEVGF